MATIAELAVSLTARTGNFSRGMKKARKTVGRFARDLKRHSKAIAGFGLAIGVAAVASLALLVRQQLKVIDSTAKFADVLGLTTEQLTGYQLAAKITGVELGQLNTGFARFQKNIGDAEDGLSTSKRALDKLNLSWQDLKNLAVDDQIKLVADRFAALDNQIDKSSVLLNLFGRSGLPLGKLLEGGSASLERFQAEAVKAGLAFNRIDASKVEAANDAMTRLKERLTGIVNILTIAVAPALVVASEKFQAFGGDNIKLGETIRDTFAAIAKKIASLADVLQLVKGAWLVFQGLIQAGAALIILPLIGIAKAFQEVANLIPGINIAIGDRLISTMSDFASASIESGAKAAEAFENFKNGLNSKKVDSFLGDVEKKSKALEKNLKKTFSPVDVGGKDKTTKKATEFLNVDITKIAFGGLQSKKKKNDVSDGKAHDLLEQIVKNTKGPQVAVAV